MSLQSQQIINKILSLSRDGLSTRKIAQLVGVSHVYVSKVIKKAIPQIITQKARESRGEKEKEDLPFNQVDIAIVPSPCDMSPAQRKYIPEHLVDNANRLLITTDSVAEEGIRELKEDLKEYCEQIRRIKKYLEMDRSLESRISLECLLMRVVEKKGTAQHKMMMVKQAQANASKSAVQIAIFAQSLPEPLITRRESVQADPMSVEAIIKTIRRVDSPQ
jgi:hypothetical protein